MLTVKHISNGVECVYLASSTRCDQPGDLARVRLFIDGDADRDLDDGKVYVMNEQGSTVATYHLDDKNKAVRQILSTSKLVKRIHDVTGVTELLVRAPKTGIAA